MHTGIYRGPSLETIGLGTGLISSSAVEAGIIRRGGVWLGGCTGRAARSWPVERIDGDSCKGRRGRKARACPAEDVKIIGEGVRVMTGAAGTSDASRGAAGSRIVGRGGRAALATGLSATRRRFRGQGGDHTVCNTLPLWGRGACSKRYRP
jgi:hypothetical protein